MNNALSPPAEKELVLLLQQGDRRAFERLYHHYKRKVYNKLRKILHSDEHAEELLQEVFYKLWVKRHLLDPEKSFPAYLYRIAANLVNDYFRDMAMDQKLQDHLIATATELYDHIEPLIDYKQSHEQLQQLIAALPPQRQRIFNLCKIEGKTYEEVSKLLGISTTTINDHIVKATRTIKAQFPGYRETALTVFTTYLLHHR